MTMTFKLRTHTSRALAALLSITAATSVFAEDDILATAKDFVAKASAKSTEWTGPTTGPTAQSVKTIVYVSSDQRNSGVTGVADGAKEAAKVIGWNFRVIDGMVPGLAAAGVSPSGQIVNISAGDGSLSAYQRVQGSQYQDATIPEPLHLHGWQLVDELNRAFAGQSPSGFNSPVHIVTPDNVEFDGGDKATYDPQNGYREAYKKIWGK